MFKQSLYLTLVLFGAQVSAASKGAESGLVDQEGTRGSFTTVQKQGPTGLQLRMAAQLGQGTLKLLGQRTELRKKKQQKADYYIADARGAKELQKEAELVGSILARFSSPHLENLSFHEKVEIDNLVNEVEGVRNTIPALLDLERRLKTEKVQAFGLAQDPEDLRKYQGVLGEAYDALIYTCKHGTETEMRSAQKGLQDALVSVQSLLGVKELYVKPYTPGEL